MALSLISPEEEQKLLERLLRYYQQLYPDIHFRTKEKMLERKELGRLEYTYAGEEIEASAEEKMHRIGQALVQRYHTPLIVLKKKNRAILLDGHRRARVAYAQGKGWRAYLLLPDREQEFGVEKTILGKLGKRFSVRRKAGRKR